MWITATVDTSNFRYHMILSILNDHGVLIPEVTIVIFAMQLYLNDETNMTSARHIQRHTYPNLRIKLQ
jgi:hypothetical protein